MSGAARDLASDNEQLEVTVVVHPVEGDEELRERQLAAIVRLLRHAAERSSETAGDGA